MGFAIIGAGMAGILAAIKLREAGHTNVTIYEKASRIGGNEIQAHFEKVVIDHDIVA